MVQAAAVQAREFYRMGQLLVQKPEIPPSQMKLIRSALQHGHQLAAPKKKLFTDVEALRILDCALGLLLAQKDTQAGALILSQHTADLLRDRKAVAVRRCEALVLLQRRDEAVAEADRLLALMPADAGRDAAVLDFLKASKLAHGAKVPTRLHDAFWGPPAATLTAMVAGLDPALFGGVFDAAFLDYLNGTRQNATEDLAGIRSKLDWGFTQACYMAMLETTGTSDGDGAAAPMLARYRQDFAQIRTTARVDPLLPLLQQGKSVVLLQSHCGIRGLVSSALAQLDWPLSLIGQSKRVERERTEDCNITTKDTANLPIQFLKLAKLMKKSQRIVRIFPDGRDGREMRQIDLFGRRIMIGMGGAALAFYGKAQLAFAKTAWNGSGWDIQVDIGPDLALAANIGQAEDIFADYYARNLCDILTGPAEGIGGLGGMIQTLRFHFDEPARSFPLGHLFVPPSGLPEADTAAIRAALGAERDKSAPGIRNLTFHQANQTIVTAGWALGNDPATADLALILARGAAGELRDSKAIAQLRLTMIGRREGRAALVAEANRLLALPALKATLDEMIVRLLDQHHALHLLTPLERLHDLIWGLPDKTYAATLNGLKTGMFQHIYSDDLLIPLCAERGRPVSEMGTLRNELAWLPCQNAYWTFLRSMTRRDPGRPPVADREAQLRRDSHFVDLVRQSDDIGFSRQMPLIRGLIKSGHGIMMLHSHSNPAGVWPKLLNDLAIPFTVVAKAPGAGRGNPADFDLATGDAATIATQYHQLTKLMRKGPRLTRIFPDGDQGQSAREVEILGRAVPIGMAGSMLAFLGKATLVFAHAHWTGHRWRADFRIGPDLARAADQATADDLFADFYADCLRNLLRGPLRDVGSTGGFLAMLNRPAP